MAGRFDGLRDSLNGSLFVAGSQREPSVRLASPCRPALRPPGEAHVGPCSHTSLHASTPQRGTPPAIPCGGQSVRAHAPGASARTARPGGRPPTARGASAPGARAASRPALLFPLPCAPRAGGHARPGGGRPAWWAWRGRCDAWRGRWGARAGPARGGAGGGVTRPGLLNPLAAWRGQWQPRPSSTRPAGPSARRGHEGVGAPHAAGARAGVSRPGAGVSPATQAGTGTPGQKAVAIAVPVGRRL